MVRGLLIASAVTLASMGAVGTAASAQTYGGVTLSFGSSGYYPGYSSYPGYRYGYPGYNYGGYGSYYGYRSWPRYRDYDEDFDWHARRERWEHWRRERARHEYWEHRRDQWRDDDDEDEGH